MLRRGAGEPRAAVRAGPRRSLQAEPRTPGVSKSATVTSARPGPSEGRDVNSERAAGSEAAGGSPALRRPPNLWAPR
jgi:hypothetical protein